MTPRLSSVPDRPRRAIGYVRVSMAREEMVSPELQLAAIETYCEQRGLRLVDTIEELDVSGRNFARAGVIDAIERIERNEAEAIVVWKVSRFGRTRKDWYIHADRVEVAGGTLESATEAFDPLTSTGRLTRGMLVELAAWESDVKSEQWKEAQAHRLRQGLPHTPTPRFGYVYNHETKIHDPDPTTGPILAECYRRYIAGETTYQIAKWLNSIPVTTSTGATWTDGSLRGVLSRGFGAGYLWRRQSKEHLPGAHQPVIDAKTWKAYQRRKAEIARTPPRSRRGTNPLTGLVVCGRDGCGKTMNIWQGWVNNSRKHPEKRKFYRGYKCYRGCGRNYVGLPTVTEAVKAWLEAEVAADVVERAEIKAQQNAKRAVAKADKATLQRQLVAANKSLSRAFEGWARGITPDSAYEDVRAALTAEIEALEARIAEVDGEVQAQQTNVPRLARSLLKDYDTLTEQNPAGMKAVLTSLIREIVVTPGKLDPADKVEVVPRWA